MEAVVPSRFDGVTPGGVVGEYFFGFFLGEVHGGGFAGLVPLKNLRSASCSDSLGVTSLRFLNAAAFQA